MKPGFKFKNENRDLTIILCEGSDRNNVALLIQENTVCPFITVRNLSEKQSGNYDWTWGHYFNDLGDALTDYNKRMTDLLVLRN